MNRATARRAPHTPRQNWRHTFETPGQYTSFRLLHETQGMAGHLTGTG